MRKRSNGVPSAIPGRESARCAKAGALLIKGCSGEFDLIHWAVVGDGHSQRMPDRPVTHLLAKRATCLYSRLSGQVILSFNCCQQGTTLIEPALSRGSINALGFCNRERFRATVGSFTILKLSSSRWHNSDVLVRKGRGCWFILCNSLTRIADQKMVISAFTVAFEACRSLVVT